MLLDGGVISLLVSSPAVRNVSQTPHSFSALKIRDGNRPPKLTTHPNRSNSNGMGGGGKYFLRKTVGEVDVEGARTIPC